MRDHGSERVKERTLLFTPPKYKSDTFDAAHKVFKGVLILGVYRAPLDNSLVTKWVTLF